MKIHIPFLLSLLLLCMGCAEAELPVREYYKLSINTPAVDANGVTFAATVSGVEGEPIVERGFLLERHFRNSQWYDDTVLETYYVPLEGTFQYRVENDWDAGVTCKISAFMRTKSHKYSSEKVEFVPLGSPQPVVHSITPQNGGHSGNIVIRGENFSEISWRIRVYLGGEQCELLSVSQNELTVTYSGLYLVGDYDLQVYVGDKKVVVDKAFHVNGPRIVSVSPSTVYPGLELIVEVDDFDPSKNVEVRVGYVSAYVLEKTTNRIRCICPWIEEEATSANLHLFLRDEDIYTPAVTVQLQKLWANLGVEGTEPESPYIILGNEGYAIPAYTIRKFDKTRLAWQNLAPFPDNFNAVAFFGKGDYLYLVGTGIYVGEPYTTFKFHLPTQTWTEISDPFPVQLSVPNYGEWVGGEYYLSGYCYDSGICLLKFNPLTETWTLVNNQMSNLYRFFSINNKVYALLERSLYEYDMDKQVRGKLVYEFPAYLDIYWSTILCKDNLLYGASASMSDSRNIFSFDLERLELKPLGLPFGYYYGFSFILPFREGLWVGTVYPQSGVYEYIGAK